MTCRFTTTKDMNKIKMIQWLPEQGAHPCIDFGVTKVSLRLVSNAETSSTLDKRWNTSSIGTITKYW